MILDFHTHIFSERVRVNRETYCARDKCFSALYSSPKARLCGVEELIASMDERQIDKSVVLNMGWASHELCVETNDYILESAARYPDRLIAFCGIQLEMPELAVKEMDRCRRSGARGVGELHPDILSLNLENQAVMQQITGYATKNNMLFLMHASEPVGHPYAGKGEYPISRLYNFIRNNRETKVILAHLGGGLPFYELMPEVTDILGNTYYDTAAIPFLYKPEVYLVLMKICGSNKILFGSDWPLLKQDRVIKQIEASGISQPEKDNILYNNAAELLNSRGVLM